MTVLEPRSSRPDTDRRTQRTRAAILQAFRHMVLSVGFDAMTPSALAEAANVGRSTFYEHFANLDEVLAFSMAGLLKPLAACAMKPDFDPATTSIVQHFWDNRKIAKAMLLGGGGRHVILRLLTEQFEVGLAALRAKRGVVTPATAPKLAAAHLAAGVLAILGAWLSGQASGSAQQIAEAIHAAGYASACALSAESKL